MNVTVFDDVRSKKVKASLCPKAEVYELISKNPELADVVCHCRQILETRGEDSYKAEKVQLPAVAWCGEFQGGHDLDNLTKYNNAICVDVDHLDDPVSVKNRLKQDPAIEAIFTSPSGKGLKIIIPLSQSAQVETWNAQLCNGSAESAREAIKAYHLHQHEFLTEHFSGSYGLTIDPKCSDPNRLCFVSSDPEAYVRQTATVPLPLSTTSTERSVKVSSASPAEPKKKAGPPSLRNHGLPEEDKDSERMSLSQAEWRLALIPADDYETWRNIGLALCNHFNGAENAFQLFNRWSSKSRKYKGESDCRDKIWRYCQNTARDSAQVTIASLCRYYWEHAQPFHDRILNDKGRTHEIYSLVLSRTNTSYLVKLRDGWKEASERAAAKYIEDYFLGHNVIPKKSTTSQIIASLYLISERYNSMSCFEAGVRKIQNKYYLIEQNAKMVTPVKGEWPTIGRLCELSLPEKDREMLYSRLKLDLQGYMRRDPGSLGQVNIFCGEVSTGKTTFAINVYSKLLGGSAEATSILLSTTHFNKETLEYPLSISDDSIKRPTGMSENEFRHHLAQMIKLFTVQSPNRFEGKYMDPITLEKWYRRLILCANKKAEILRLLPDPSSDVADKYNIFHFTHSFDGDPEGLNPETIESECRAFAYFLLNEWTIPGWIKSSQRFGIASYHNEDLAREIFEASPEATLWDFITLVMAKNQRRGYGGLANEIHREISEDVEKQNLHSRQWDMTRSNTFHSELSALKKQLPDQVYIEGSTHGKSRWVIESPNTAKAQVTLATVKKELLGKK